jgi:outer membrane protein assembly factor BamB
MASASLAAGDQDNDEGFRAFPSAIEWVKEVSSGVIAPPVVAGGHVIVPLQSGHVSARRLTDGTEAWQVELAVTAPLAAADDLVVVSVKGAIRALDAATGREKWTKHADLLGTPPVVRGGWVILAAGEVLTALRAADGMEVWSKTIAPIAQRSAIDGDRLFVPLVDGRMIAVELTSGALLWEERNLGLNLTEPFVYGDRVYFGANGKQFVCLKAANGEEESRFQVGAAIVGVGAADESRVYTVSMDNLLRAFDRGTGNLEWKQDIGYRPTGGPILTGSQVAVPGRTAVIQAYDVATHRPAVKLEVPSQTVTQPALVPPRLREGSAGQGGEPGRIAVIVNEVGKPWLLVLAAEAPPAPPALPIAPLSALPGTSLPIPKLPI